MIFYTLSYWKYVLQMQNWMPERQGKFNFFTIAWNYRFSQISWWIHVCVKKFNFSGFLSVACKSILNSLSGHFWVLMLLFHVRVRGIRQWSRLRHSKSNLILVFVSECTFKLVDSLLWKMWLHSLMWYPHKVNTWGNLSPLWLCIIACISAFCIPMMLYLTIRLSLSIYSHNSIQHIWIQFHISIHMGSMVNIIPCPFSLKIKLCDRNIG